MATNKVVAINNEKVAEGGSGNKTWSRAEVTLDNGYVKQIFNPVKVGDTVESYKNGEYWNYRVVKDEEAATPTPTAPVVAPTVQPVAPTPVKSVTKIEQGKTDWADKDAKIQAQWAIGRATELAAAGTIKFDDIEAEAFGLFDMVGRVKQGLAYLNPNKPKATAEEVLGGEPVNLV